MKKRNISLVCLLLFVLSLTATTTYFAAETYFVDGDWKYSTSSAEKSEYSIAEYLGEGTRVNVPATFLTKPVVKISEAAFLNHPFLQYCEIPDTITEIGESAFYGCNQLKQIVIPDNVETIGKYAFYGCSTMVMVQFETAPSLKVIPEQAFNYCYALSMVNISEGVEKIDKLAFNDCSMLSSIIIPPSVTEIADDAFKGCTGLTIWGWENTYAQEFASANNVKYMSMGEYREPTEPPVIPTENTKVTTATETTPSVITDPSEIITSSIVTEPVSSEPHTEIFSSVAESTFVTIATDPTESTVTDPTETTNVTNPTSEPVVSVPGSSSVETIFPSESSTTTTDSTFETYFIGDSDLDGRITVKDATLIQKSVAKLIALNHKQKFIANTDGKGGITVKDATQIQKYVAGYTNILFIGTEVEL